MNTSNKISLNRPSADYTADEEIFGSISVQMPEEGRVESVEIELDWRARARGDSFTATADEMTLHRGPLTELGNQSMPFSLRPTPGPYPYAGNMLEVDWLLVGRIGYEDGSEERVQRPIEVVPPEDPEPYNAGMDGSIPNSLREEGDSPESLADRLGLSARRLKQLKAGTGFTFGIACIAAISVLAVYGSSEFGRLVEIYGPAPIAVAVAFAVIVVGALVGRTVWGAYGLARELSHNIIHRNPYFSIARSRVIRGAPIPVELAIPSHRIDEIESIAIELKGSENMDVEVGDSVLHDHWRLETRRRALDTEEGDLEASEGLREYRCELEVPEDAPFSLYTPPFSIEWEVSAEIEFDGEEIWRDRRPIIVEPERGRSSDSLRDQ